jgi:hypothetical protein
MRLKHFSLLLFLLLASGSVGTCFGQNQNSIWCFGDSSGIDFGKEQHKILLPQLTREGHARQFPIVRVICYFIVEQVRDLAEELEEYIPVIIC